LKGDTRYTLSTCFTTFPFPQTPSAKIVQQIRTKALELHQYRSDQMEQKQWGITKLYNAYFHEPASSTNSTNSLTPSCCKPTTLPPPTTSSKSSSPSTSP
jgi:hypothetical protein